MHSLSQLLHLLQFSCKSLSSLKLLHAHLLSNGFLSNSSSHSTTSVSSLLITFYSSFNQPNSALSVLTSLPSPSLFLWNTLIKSQLKSNHPQTAVEFYHLMLQNGYQPDSYTYTFVLKACASAHDSKMGRLVHEDIKRRNFCNDLFISTALVDMYCKLGFVSDAREVFDSMKLIDIATWNAMIGGLSKNHCSIEALKVFKTMQMANQAPNFITVLNLFPSISHLSNLSLCKTIHCFSIKSCLLDFVFNGLIDSYGKCGSLEIAHKLFDEMLSIRNDVTWATIISGFVYNGFYTKSLELFDAMRISNVKLNQVAVLSALTATSETKNLQKGLEIHNLSIQNQLDFNLGVKTALFTMYAKCGDIEKSKSLFKTIKNKDLIAWSAIISCCAQNGYIKDAILFLKEMQIEGIKPNIITIISVLPSCADLSDIRIGKSIHCFALKSQMVLDLSIQTSLLSFYAKCGFFKSARVIFNKLNRKEIVAFNALINGYLQFDKPLKALEIFSELRFEGISPDFGTMVSVIPCYASLNALKEGKSLHATCIKLGLDFDLHVKNAILELYAKCGDGFSSDKIFDETKCFEDVISWNTMLSGYMHNGKPSKAILTFRKMRKEYIKPNFVTLITIIPAFSHLALLKDGTILYSYIFKLGFGPNISIGNCLIDMYSKSGKLDYARKVFDEMKIKDSISYNSMILGYSIHGLGFEALSLFKNMEYNSIKRDNFTYLAVLSACRHNGLVSEGKRVFNSIKNENKLVEHFACMIDLLGHVGKFDEVLKLINDMKKLEIRVDVSIWGAILGACKMHGNMKLGEIALREMEKLKPKNAAHYVVVSNLYAQNERWNEARKMREIMRLNELNKTPGCSW